MNKIYNFWYIDEKEVECIWNQYHENIVEKIINTNYQKSFSIKVGGDINALKLVELESESGIQFGKIFDEQIKIEPSIERKIINIIEKIGGIAVDIEDVLCKNCGTELVFVRGYFGLKEIYITGQTDQGLLTNVYNIKSAEILVWHFKYLSNYKRPIGFCEKRQDIEAMRYDFGDVGLEKQNVTLDMFAGGEKIRVGIKHLTSRIEYMRPFWFQIIGWLEYIDENKWLIISLCEMTNRLKAA